MRPELYSPPPAADVQPVRRERLTGSKQTAQAMALKSHAQAVGELDSALAECDRQIQQAEEAVLEENLSPKLKQSRAYNVTRLKARKASLERSRKALEDNFAKERKALRLAEPPAWVGRTL